MSRQYPKRFYLSLIAHVFDEHHGAITDTPLQPKHTAQHEERLRNQRFWSDAMSGTANILLEEGSAPPRMPDLLKEMHGEQEERENANDGAAQTILEALRREYLDNVNYQPGKTLSIGQFITLCDRMSDFIVQRVCVCGDDPQLLDVGERVMQAMRRAYAIHDGSEEVMKGFARVEQKYRFGQDNLRFIDRQLKAMAPGVDSLFVCSAHYTAARHEGRAVNFSAPLSLSDEQAKEAENGAKLLYLMLLRQCGLTNQDTPQFTAFVPAMIERARLVADAEYFRTRDTNVMRERAKAMAGQEKTGQEKRYDGHVSALEDVARENATLRVLKGRERVDRKTFVRDRTCALVKEALRQFPPITLSPGEALPGKKEQHLYHHEADPLAKAMEWIDRQRVAAQGITR